MTRVARDLWLFFWRDLTIARTYRAPFILEAIEALFGAAMFYYMSRFVDSPQLRNSLPQGTTYFAFALVGWIFFEYLHTAIDTFDESRSDGSASSMILSQSGFQVSSSPNSAFCCAIGVGGAGFSCAWGGVTGD